MFSRVLLRSLEKIFKTTGCTKRNYSPKISFNKVTDSTVKSLRDLLGEKKVFTEEAVREQHSHDESYHTSAMPDVVVFPDSVEYVSKVVAFCNTNRIPVVPYGTGTGLEGGVNAVQGGVSINMKNMDKVVEVNGLDFDVTVQPGITREALNSYCRDTGMWFPIDPGADCSVCGMCATSASGTNAVKYGTMRENVLNLEVVLPDGRIIHTSGKGRRAKKTSAGFNMTNLFVGSEGTLGIITQATVKMHGIPEKTVVAYCHFKKIEDAVDTVIQIVSSGIPVAKCEFLDDSAIKAFNAYSDYHMPVAHSLFMEVHGPEASVHHLFNEITTLCISNNGYGFTGAEQAEDRARLWKARHEMLYAVNALVPGSKSFVTDVCVPVTKLTEIIVKTKQWIDKANIIGPIVGHVGDGNFHVFFPIKPGDTTALNTVLDISKQMVLLSLALNGTCTGEHGIGLGKRKYLLQEVGEDGVSAMQQVKQALDPNGIMNPGKIFY
ncbi:unnamed protein product [Candidula unifasciata]|uniref:Probable D-lactate dehydrogenase, mitochondrial n=1 Tax=Candidula unifasciata TaxID=100452 RepID=A0A8S3ZGE1_9EUPU|nr:unnamed protein product [Candidula unifasciata]